MAAAQEYTAHTAETGDEEEDGGSRAGIGMAIRRKAVWAVSNIAAGTREQIQQVLDAGALKLACRLSASHRPTDDPSVQALAREAVFSVTNACCGGDANQV